MNRADVQDAHPITPWASSETALSPDHVRADGPETAGLRRLSGVLRFVSETDATILIVGERGVEMRQVARLIHAMSRRRRGRLLTLDCASVTADGSALAGLDESARGVSSRASRPPRGSTLFLHDVADLSPGAQGRLVEVLQRDQRDRACGRRSADVRIVAGTARNLRALVETGAFREDLYYRLDVLRVNVPPLRQRRDEIPAIVRRLVARYADRHRAKPRPIPPQTMQRLVEYSWPGNFSELENVVERMVVFGTDRGVIPSSAAPRRAVDPRPAAPRRLLHIVPGGK